MYESDLSIFTILPNFTHLCQVKYVSQSKIYARELDADLQNEFFKWSFVKKEDKFTTGITIKDSLVIVMYLKEQTKAFFIA